MSYSQLTYEDRIRIDTLTQEGKTPTEVSRKIGKHRSTIYRELNRNQSVGVYFAKTAQILAENRKIEASSAPRIDEDKQEWVIKKLNEQWSPEQISNRMKQELNGTVSHEWIYQMVYKDKKEGGKLHLNLRWGRKTRKKRVGSDKRGQIPNRVSIENRPIEINNRTRIGDFEGDLVVGANHNGALLTLVDRTSRYAMIKKIPSKNAEITAQATIETLANLKGDKHTITFDNGKEFSAHEKISTKANVSIYFAHPYSSFERGTNENTNGLIRQYFPKKTDISKVSKKSINKVESLINHRPRKVLGFKTAHEVHFGITLQYFAST